MTCSACGQENRDTAKFCRECGQRFSVTCSRCEAELPAGARFCDECGAPVDAPAPGQPVAEAPVSYTPRHLADKILTTRSSLEGERKQVAVLFADVAGSTALAEGLDPEDMHGIMDRCFRLLMEEVHRYEGTINQFTGDGIMALFGAPIAHEDASERAVRAALGMQAALRRYGEELRHERGIDFRMRIGVHTGPVVVGKIGDDLRMDYTAVGDTTNLAARLQSAAAPGAILISEQTAKLVAGRFVTRPVGPLHLKGKSRPVTAHEVERALPRAPLVAPSESGLTRLIGRAAELAALEKLFAHVRAGRGQVVFVAGEAGIGKSRVLHELRHRLAGETLTWAEGRCISFGRRIPFLPIIDVLKHVFAVEEGDDEQALIEKIERGVAALGPEVQAVAPHLRAMLAVDPGDPAVAGMDPSARHFAAFDALKRLMLGAAAQQPLVICIEDLHWIDPASEECLTYVIDALAGARVLLLCTYRPGFRPTVGERSFITRLALQPLSRGETAAMAAAMLDAGSVPQEIRALLTEKAEGNPFFIEEVTKSLVEIGALRRTSAGYELARPPSEIVIPDTIQDVIAARIDRLGEEAKRAIQIASVIGREFALRLLQRATALGDRVEPLVDELRALELIYEKAGVPELAYMFKHALTHDVAYASLLVQRRKRLHRVIGQAVEELYADRLPEYWETLAYHYERAEEWPRAFTYLVKAGDKALAAFANTEAAHFYERALAAAEHFEIDPGQRAAILKAKGQAHCCVSEFAAAVAAYRDALGCATTAGDRARINVALAEGLWYAHEFDAALQAADAALAIAEPLGDTMTVGLAHLFRSDVFLVRGDLAATAAGFETTAQLAARTQQRRLAALAHANQALVANWRGDYHAATERQEQVLATLSAENQLFDVAMVSSNFGIALGGAGRYDRALATLGEGIALAESIGERFWRARMWNTRGWILGELGADEPAEEANRRCLEIARHLGSLGMAPELISNAELNLADSALMRGDLPAAEPHLAAVAAVLADARNEWMVWRYRMHYHVTAGEVALARGDLGAARRHVEACLTTARQTQSRRYLVRGSRLLAACHVAAGDLVEGERQLSAAVKTARALGNPTQLWQTLLAYGRVLHALGRHEDAVAAWREALDRLASVDRALPGDVRSALRQSPVSLTLHELVA